MLRKKAVKKEPSSWLTKCFYKFGNLLGNILESCFSTKKSINENKISDKDLTNKKIQNITQMFEQIYLSLNDFKSIYEIAYSSCEKVTPAVVPSSANGSQEIVLESQPVINESIIDEPITADDAG